MTIRGEIVYTNEEFVKLLKKFPTKSVQKIKRTFTENSNLEIPDTVGMNDHIEDLSISFLLLKQIGVINMLSFPLKTKVNVDHLGHFQQLAQLKAYTRLKRANSFHFLSNN